MWEEIISFQIFTDDFVCKGPNWVTAEHQAQPDQMVNLVGFLKRKLLQVSHTVFIHVS